MRTRLFDVLASISWRLSELQNWAFLEMLGGFSLKLSIKKLKWNQVAVDIKGCKFRKTAILSRTTRDSSIRETHTRKVLHNFQLFLFTSFSVLCWYSSAEIVFHIFCLNVVHLFFESIQSAQNRSNQSILSWFRFVFSSLRALRGLVLFILKIVDGGDEKCNRFF